MQTPNWSLNPDRFFDPEPAQRAIAGELYESVRHLPLLSPHSHVNPLLFSTDEFTFGTPVELLIMSDHYIFRMLYSQGVPLEALGIPHRDGRPVERDHRRIWQIFADNFYLFRGTPSGVWLKQELIEVFGVENKLDGESAQEIYDQISEKLTSPEFSPRALFERFKIEVLCTTDPAGDRLAAHQAIRDSGWGGDIRPTFRPDRVIHLLAPGWKANIDDLSEASRVEINSYASFIRALEVQRGFFKSLGAVATDQAAESAFTAELTASDAEAIFQRALRGQAGPDDAKRFSAHMLMESARMSIVDGLVMQVHIGSFRNHNQVLYEHFGADVGSDIPVHSEFTRSLRPLLNNYGNDSRLNLIIFTLDEANYARELAPLAGHYPALKLGPPWWFHDSQEGMRRYFNRVMETAGLYNTSGFNDDARAFPSIPARHDVWRRASANWLAGLVVRDVVDMQDAGEMIKDLAYRLVKRAYKL